MTITYAQRISNRLATLRSDNSARGACEAIAAEADAEIERLRAALAKIADWDSNWGPFPENNEAWRAMVVVTAREAVPELEPNNEANRAPAPLPGN